MNTIKALLLAASPFVFVAVLSIMIVHYPEVLAVGILILMVGVLIWGFVGMFMDAKKYFDAKDRNK